MYNIVYLPCRVERWVMFPSKHVDVIPYFSSKAYCGHLTPDASRRL